MERGPARARALMRLSIVRGYDDDLRAAEALLREALDEAEGDDELVAAAHNQLCGMLFRLRERLREAVEHGDGGRSLGRGGHRRRGAGRPPAVRGRARRRPDAPTTLRRALSSSRAASIAA